MISQCLQQTTLQQQRQLLWLQGDEHWAIEQIKQQLPSHCHAVCYPSSEAFNNTENIINITNKFQRLLGQETEVVIINAYKGFNPDAFAALTGTIKMGGLCILITPSADSWCCYDDPDLNRYGNAADINQRFYIKRLVSLLNKYDVAIQYQHQEAQHEETLLEDNNQQPYQIDYSGQQQAVSCIVNLKNNEAVTLQSHRGRGKSAALGMSAGQLLRQAAEQDQSFNILLCSALKDSVGTVFKHVLKELNPTELHNTDNPNTQQLSLNGGKQSLIFVAPDVLAFEHPTADLVLVDEAASIPTPLLISAFKHYSKMVFATTVHGYEGTGRAFEYKLKPAISQHFEQHQVIDLVSPIRWRPDDKLEPIVNSLLGLNFSIDACEFLQQKPVIFQYWTAKQLYQNEAILEQIFALLINAHYQTSPQDLRQLLDANNLSVFTLMQGEGVLAAAIVATEGNIANDLIEPIWQGKRRPKGHLMPQSLIFHSGFKQAGGFCYFRVVRIATHPQWQKYGLGSRLLTELQKFAEQNPNIDFLATSFGGSEPLINFWHKNQFSVVRVGLKAQASNGELSVFMLKALNSHAKEFMVNLVDRCQQSLLVEQQFNIRPELPWLSRCLLSKSKPSMELTADDVSDLNCFAEHFRPADTVYLAIWRWLAKYKHQLPPHSALIDKYDVGLTNPLLIQKYKLSGEKQLVTRLRNTLKQLITLVK